MKQYVDRLSGEPARRQACRSGVSEVAVEVFVNNAGYPSTYAFPAHYPIGTIETHNRNRYCIWWHQTLNYIAFGYWRDKRGHEIDFVLARRGQVPLALECKWSADDVDLTNLKAFALRYPTADLRVIAHDVDRSYQRRTDAFTVTYCGLQVLLSSLNGQST